MTTQTLPFKVVTVADLLRELGDLPADRVRFYPIPGTATVDDVIEIERRENRLCELVEGVLVEKPMGFREALLAAAIVAALRSFVRSNKSGVVVGADGMVQLVLGLVRIPDVAYVSWARLPEGRVPEEQVPRVVPDLAVEVLSPSNTTAEMQRKLREYFTAGVRLVWLIDARRRTCAVYTAADQSVQLSERDTIEGGDVLPGFQLPLAELFAELDQAGE